MRWRRRAVGSLIAGIVVAIGFAVPSAAQEQGVLVADVNGPITPVVADHLEAAVAEAGETGAVLIVTMDTPGGLDTSMRDIVQTFLNAPIPVVVYVQPEGARAASAGTFITMAAHVAAMAPATSIGAATPVDLQGGEISDKILNDASAFAVSVAERKGRNVEFAEAAVRDGTSLTATQALEQEVVDLIADNLDDLLAAIDGMRVEVLGIEVELATGEAVPDVFEMSALRRILAVIADPNIAILFLSIGTLAVVYEAANPGLGFAGIMGVILLLLGFFALSVLPVNAAGLALLILAITLFVAEIFVPGIGVLAAGGTIALLLAGVFLFEGELQVSPPVLWPTALVMGVTTTIAGRAAVKARLHPATSGAETLIGKPVTVVSEEDGRWSAFLEGSWWAVRSSSGELAAGDVMEVVDIEGLDLIVEPVGGKRES
jgi:membrane-bound serine protease (ClpP class)